MTIRCYVASAFRLRGEVRDVHGRLDDIGILATSRWANAEGTGPETVTEETAEAIYTQNDADVASSHVMLVVAREGLGAEMFAECRFALTLRIPVLWTGNRTCLSSFRPGCVRLPSLDSAIAWLVSARLDVSRPFPTSDAWKRDVLWSRAAYASSPSIPAAPADDADDTIPRLSLSDIYEGRT